MYFSRQGGLEETRHVFIDGNDLPARFANCKQFVVGETGFGSGLNFIATVDCWLQTAAADARLHYISVEKHPFTPGDIQQALAAWPALAHITQALLEIYPPLVHGFHPRRLFDGRVHLTLLFGEAEALFADLEAEVDAWFLDGFSPARNETLWSDAVLQHITACTAHNGSLATFTAAGDVRRRLQALGFSISKRPGFGRKREMLTGRLEEKNRLSSAAPWFHPAPCPRDENRHAIVIGAGVAGITTAAALAQRGWHIDLIERHASIASEASGNPAGVVLPRLTADMSLDARFYLSAFLHTVGWLQQLQSQNSDIGWHRVGVVQLLDAVKQQALQRLALPASIVAGLNGTEGVPLEQAGVLYSLAGWLEPQRLCQALLQQYPQIHLQMSTAVQELVHDAGEWQVRDHSAVIAAAPIVILANGSAARQLLPQYAHYVQAVRGQLTYVEGGVTDISRPVCYDGYVIPLSPQHYCLGASYDRHSSDSTLREQDQKANLAALQRSLPALGDLSVTGGRVAFRASTIDHLPMVGPVGKAAFYQQHYADLYHGRPAARYPLAEYEPGLYLNTGHGSRGLTTCPLAAEMLAAMLSGEPSAVPQDIRHALHPERFRVRDLKRQLPGE